MLLVGAKPQAEEATDKPTQTKFDLQTALSGMKGETASCSPRSRRAWATSRCKLFDDKAPITVANFIGLARGKRPWKDPDGKWVKKPRTTARRSTAIIKGFMIQGGDPKGNGSGEPGYVIPDEMWAARSTTAPASSAWRTAARTRTARSSSSPTRAAPHLDGATRSSARW